MVNKSTRTASPRLILIIVAFGVFVAADDLTVVTTMLRPIISDLGLVLPDGLDDAAWIVNAYLIAYVAVMPFAGRLSDVLGRRRVFIAGLVLFLAGSIVTPLADSLGVFILGRVLSALGGGALVPVGMAVVSDVYSEPRRARSLGTLAAVDTLGWVWGPLYGAALVRLLSWHWQFYLNIPLALVAIAVSWRALAAHDRPVRRTRLDWVGAGLLTVGLVTLNLALLGSAEIQSVSGLEELTGTGGSELRWLFLITLVAAVLFVWRQRRADDPLIDSTMFSPRNSRIAALVNFLVGSALVIAMVDVPIFINVLESDAAKAAVIAGLVLTSLTAAMALFSYVGGRATEKTWYRPPVLAGLAGATAAFALMGFGWDQGTSYVTMAWQLALLGIGFGLVIAPTAAAVIDAAPAAQRGVAASLVLVTRLTGLSVGLSALTAWGLHRFNEMRAQLVLPEISDPGFTDAVSRAQATLTAEAITETFLAAAMVLALALVAASFMRRKGPRDEGDDVSPETKRILPIVGVGILLAISLAVNGALFLGMRQTRADLARVEGGSALFAAQVSGFQEQLSSVAPAVSQGLDEAIAGLETFKNSTLELSVPIDETISIETQILIDRELTVPIKTTLPLNQTFDTTITVQAPLGVDIPLDVTVPVQTEVPVDLTVSLPVNERVPVSTAIPVQIEVPIRVAVADTELAALAESLAQGLASFKELLAATE